MIRASALDRLQHARDAPERQRRGAESHDLLVGRCAVAADDLHGIGGRVLAIVVLVQLLEPFAELPRPRPRVRDRPRIRSW